MSSRLRRAGGPAFDDGHAIRLGEVCGPGGFFTPKEGDRIQAGAEYQVV